MRYRIENHGRVRVFLLIVASAGIAGACGAPRPFGSGVEIQTLLYGGERLLAHDEFDGHTVWGLELATTERSSGWGYEAQWNYGAEEGEVNGVEDDAEFDEFALGLRRTWRSVGALRTVLGAGAAYTQVEHIRRSTPTRLTDETGAAGYAHVALQWVRGMLPFDPGTEFVIGVDVRALAGDDYEYAQIALVLGFGR